MTNSNQDWARRKFIATVAGAGLAVISKPVSALGISKRELDPGVAEIVSKMIGIDIHNHIDVPFNTEEFSKLK